MANCPNCNFGGPGFPVGDCRCRSCRQYVTYKGPKEPMSPEVKERLRARAAEDTRIKSWLRLWARVGMECVRPVARAYLDSGEYISGATPPWVSDAGRDEYDALCRLALVDYKLRFPQARGERLFISRPVEGEPGDADYHCRFCGKHLLRSGKGIAFFGDKLLHRHTERCALWSLAGVKAPIAPGWQAPDPETYRLAVVQLADILRAVVTAWASDVVDDTMRRFDLLEMS